MTPPIPWILGIKVVIERDVWIKTRVRRETRDHC
jgi:hypothetical protein